MKDCKIREFACLALCAMAAVASCAATAASQMPGAEIRNRTWDRLSEKGMRNGRPDVKLLSADEVAALAGRWNKAVAARLDAFPGLKGLGLVESNGPQNYVNWERMRRELPYPDAPMTRTRNGLFELGDGYWNKSGGVLSFRNSV